MSTFKKLDQLIKRAESNISMKLESRKILDREIELDEATLKGYKEARASLPQDEFRVRAETAPKKLRAGSEVSKAQKAIRDAGKPLHIQEIVSALGKEPNRKNRTSLAGSISWYVRKGEFFTKNGPNIFGLTDTDYSRNNDDVTSQLQDDGDDDKVPTSNEPDKRIAIIHSNYG